MFKKTYYYGDGTDHKIRLHPAEASAVNKLHLTPVEGHSGAFQTNLTGREMKAYKTAATKLNAYIESNAVYYSDESIEKNIPILRLAK